MTPLSHDVLVDLIVAGALPLRRSGPGAVRLAVDGPIEEETGRLADDVASALILAAVPVARIRAGDFLRQRSLRFETGRDDPESFATGWYDVGALCREVLDPLGPGGGGTWLPRLRNPDTDRPYRDPVLPASPGTVAVLDGRFLCREVTRDRLDLLVYLEVSETARIRRTPRDEASRILPAWRDYLAETDPASRADLVVRYDHPRRPAVVDRIGRGGRGRHLH